MRFFNIDFHISVIADIKALLVEHGHQVDSLSLSNHTWVFGKEKDQVPALEGMSTTSFGQRECDRFFQAESDRLENYDGFIVTHTPCLAGLYEKTNKPVICVVSTRYDTFCQTSESRAWLDDLLRRMHQSGQLVLLANNAYDAWHVSKHLGIPPEVLPSYCGYTGVGWAFPSGPPVLLGHREIAGLSRPVRGHSWTELAQSACCVAVPYNASLMSVFERHTMGMPIAVPSPKWVLMHPHSLSELRHSGSPAPDEIEAAIRLADWYRGELPGITYFHDEDHLLELLREGIPPTSGASDRKTRILDQWLKLLTKLADNRSTKSRAKDADDAPAKDLSGFWRWTDGFFGELRPDGTLIQHREANRELRFGTWATTPEGFDLELTGHWRKKVTLTLPSSGVWHLNSPTSPSGFIRRLGSSFPIPPEPIRQGHLSCDSYNYIAGHRTFVMHTDSVLEWHRRCRPATPYILLTSHSDTPIDERFQPLLNDELLEVWHAVNIRLPHEKLRPIPLGVCHALALTSPALPAGPLLPRLYEQLLFEASSSPKTKLFNVSFSTETNPGARRACLKASKLPTAAMDRRSYIRDLGASRYCLAPEGAGIDCHRTWEALYCRTIPIITWNPMVGMGLYDGLPVIVLDRWDEFDAADFTEERYERLMRGFDPASIAIERWISLSADGSPTPNGQAAHSLVSDRGLRTTPDSFVGYYRWTETHFGEFLPNGTFVQHSVPNPSDMKPGKWWCCDGKLWFELTGYWTKYALLDGEGPHRLFLVGHGEFGRLSKASVVCSAVGRFLEERGWQVSDTVCHQP